MLGERKTRGAGAEAQEVTGLEIRLLGDWTSDSQACTKITSIRFYMQLWKIPHVENTG